MCEQSAHLLRASELCRRVTRNHPSDDLLSACRAFDNAVEFAAFEGVSIAEAISEYLRDTDPRIAEVLRPVVQPGARPALTKSLPVLPSAAAKLMKISSENASVRELEAIAGSDPVLAARLLGVANSAIFGRTAEIRSLKQAVLRLGIPLARRTLLSACFGKLFASAHLVRIRRHSQTVAALSHEFAIKSGADSESAYLAGLVHDTGRIVIHCATAQLQANVNALIEAGFPCVYAETLTFGTDHAALGAELLQSWGLPNDIVEAVAFHHNPESTDSALAGIVCLAEEESRAAGAPSESLSPGMRRAAAARLAGLPHTPRCISLAV